MKTSFKTLVCAFSATLALLSCDFGTNNNELKANSNSDVSSSSFEKEECDGVSYGYGSPCGCVLPPIILPSPVVNIELRSDGEWICITDTRSTCYFIRPSIKEMPVMDNRVVSYIKMEANPSDMEHKFITDSQILKSWFPGVFNSEQTQECDYFAIVYNNSNYSYTILAYNDYTESYDQIMIRPGVCSIEIKLQMEYHAMLVCDDKAGSLKNKIRFFDTRVFEDPDWDCADG